MVDIPEELIRGFADFFCSLLVKSGYEEEEARKRIKLAEDLSSVSSAYRDVPFTVKFYENGLGKLRVFAAVEGELDLMDAVEEELDKIRSNAQLRRERGHLADRTLGYDDECGEIVMGCRVKKQTRIKSDVLYSDVWGYLLKPAIRALSASSST